MIVAGSTYSVTVSGVTSEGPEDLSLTSETLNDQWYSVDETLSAGERLILNGAFLTDVHNELQIGSSVLFGIKDGSWANTQDGNSSSSTGFEYDLCVKFKKSGITAGTINVMKGGVTQGANVIYITSMLADYSAFIEITPSGNNIRMGVAHSSQNDPINDVYSNWNAAKQQTGEQGYGLTSIDIMAFYDKASTSVAFDYNDIDWTLLSEVSVPVLASNATSWTKALDFSGGSEHTIMPTTSQAVGAVRMGGGISTVPAHSSDTSKTSDNQGSRPWATAIVFKSDGNSSNQHIWNSGEGSSSQDDNIYLRVDANGQLYFGWGRVHSSGLNEMQLASITSGQWYGVYIAHKGQRLSGSGATASNLADAFDIRLMNSGDSFATLGSNLSTSANWTTTGGRMDRSVTGDITIGGRGSNRNFHGQVASFVDTTLLTDVAMPTDAEIKMMITDPSGWLTDYKVGNTYRYAASATVLNNFQINEAYSSYATQVWLMGDGSLDSYSNGIRNEVKKSDQNYTKLQLNSMVSNDIENVTINGLS